MTTEQFARQIDATGESLRSVSESVPSLIDANIPDDITASNYLALTGGTLTGTLTGTSLTLSGNLTVSGAQTLSGAITVPYLSATSTTASSFINASTTRLSVFDTAYFGGTATSTFSSTGFLTLPSGFLSQASSTIGAGGQTTGLTISGGATTTGNAYFAGNVGIGKNAPTASLHITPGAGVYPIVATDSNSQNIFYVDPSGNANITGTVTGGSFAAGSISLNGSANSIGYSGVSYGLKLFNTGNATYRGDTTEASDLGADFAIQGTGSNDPFLVATTSGTAQFIVKNNGSIGIGTTTPWGKVSVTNTGSGPSFVVEDDTSPDSTPFIIDTSGNVGIGTASPGSKLDILQTSNSWNDGIRLSYGGVNRWQLFSGGADGSEFYLGYNSNPIIQAAGSGGISVPTANSNFAGLRVGGVDSNNSIYAGANNLGITADSGNKIWLSQVNSQVTGLTVDTTSGNVGIGTTSSYAKLSVVGPVVAEYFHATSSSASTFAGGLLSLASTTIGAGGQTSGLTISGGATTTGDAIFGTRFGSTRTLTIFAAGNGESTTFTQSNLGSFALTANTNDNSSSIAATVLNATNLGGTLFVRPLLDVQNDGASKLFVDVSGNVGIGTTTPWGKVSVTNTGSGPSFVVEDDTSPDSTPFIIDTSGNVGIGTAEPSEKLEINSGNAKLTSGSDYIVLNPSSSGAPLLQLFNSGIADAQLTATSNGFDFNNAGKFNGQLWTTGELISGVVGATGAAGTLTLRPSAGNSSYITWIENSVAYRGQLGYANGSGDLVYKSGGSNGQFDGTERLRITSDGNVGIGTTTPQSLLHLHAATPRLLMFDSDNAISSTNPAWSVRTQDGTFKIQGTTDYSAYTDRLAILPDTGNVGIGTTSPWRTLSVTGTVGFDGLTTNTGAAVASLCLSADNEVTRNTDNESCITSSERFKKNIEPLIASTSIETLLALRPVSFEYNETPGTRYGLIAEEVDAVDKTLVGYDAEVHQYPHALWGTYRQWQELGAQVRKGEHSSLVVFYKEYESEPDPNDEDDDGKRRVARHSSVFNVAQVDGFVLPDTPATSIVERDQAADAFFAAIKADIRHGGERAFYRPSEDFIQMPDERLFRGSQYGTPTEDYFCVLAHEATHWTSHGSRLNRELGKRFGDYQYSAEELVAELGSAFICAELGISPPEVYALRAWSVMKAGDNWYVAPTACFDNKPEWSKAYATLYRATTAIARKLAEEVLARQKRRAEWNGIKQ